MTERRPPCAPWRKAIPARTFSAVAAIALCSSPTFASETAVVVWSGRPLEEAALVLGQQLDTVVTYEDPVYENPCMIERPVPGGSILVPAEERLRFSYSDGESPTSALDALLTAARDDVGAAVFECSESEGIYSIYPVSVLGAAGHMVRRPAVMDTRITLSLLQTTCRGALKALCEAVSAAQDDYELTLGMVQGMGYPFAGEYKEMKARDIVNIILRYVNEMHPPGPRDRLMWSARSSPRSQDDRRAEFALNVAWIPAKVEASVIVRICHTRPVSAAAAIIQDEFKTPISYEDPPYLCPCDLLGSSPGGGMMQFSWRSGEDVAGALQTLVSTPIRPEPDPETFRVETGRRGYHIVPDRAKNESGELVRVTSVMDAAVSLPDAGITGTEAVDSFCSRLRASSGRTVRAERVAAKLRPRVQEMRIAAPSKDEAARDVLDAMVSQTTKPVSWQLLYQPGTKDYTLVLSEVGTQGSLPAPRP